MLELIVQPVGYVDLRHVLQVSREVEKRFPVEVKAYPSMWPLQPPASAYDWERMQYRAQDVNRWLRNNLDALLSNGRLALGLVGADAYVPGLNFVFGLADPELRVATVYTARLGAGADEAKFVERLAKESIHEVGHLLGLKHCANRRCVMSFSNSLEEVDAKGADFCDECSLRLTSMYQVRRQR